MNIGSIITGKVISLAYGGDGIIKNNDLIGFVRGALPDELVKLKVTEIKKKYFRAEILEIIEPSLFRVTPPCPYYNRCGGCLYQHLTYEKQLEYKVSQLTELFRHIGKIADLKISSVIPSPKIFNYRNQIVLKVKDEKLGFIGIDNTTFIPVEKCLIADEEINKKIKEIGKDLKINGDILIKCDTSGGIDYAFPESISYKAEYKLLQEKIEGKTFYFSLATFFQVNPYILPSVLKELKNDLNLGHDTILFDLYSGAGLFSIYFSSLIKNAYGIETSKSAVKLANKSAETNKIKNCRFFSGDVEDLLPKIYEQHKNKENVFFLDPPRQGLSKNILNYLKTISPSFLVYISCEPANLARDLNFLYRNGYNIKDIFIADMFPQTKYFETLAILNA